MLFKGGVDLVGCHLANRFRVERRLGEGGMGIVYEARDEEREEMVALKTIGGAGTLDGGAVYGLKKEFRALADIVHPRLVRLHELFSDDNLWFFTMARVTGLPFDAHVRKEELGAADEPVSPTAQTFSPWSDTHDRSVRRAFAQLIEGVRAIHDAGKMHLDLKPSNVLVDPSGNVVILDFGLVQSALPGLVTRDGVAGTPAYMAPEQLREGGACAASDWYAVGTMLFEVLTGRLPFGPELHAVLVAKTNEKVAPSARTFAPGAPEDLVALAADLLKPRPADRPSAEEIATRIGYVHETPLSPTLSLGPRAPFVGRTKELARLRSLFDRARKDGALGVYVAGLSGMGKTTLIDRFLEQVRRDAVVLRGRCYERESVPFKALDPVVDALSRHLLLLPPVAAARVTPRDTPELCRLFPVLARVGVLRDVMNARPPAPDPQELRRRGFGALCEVFTRLADVRPLVVALDDLQWGDLDSGLFFAQLLALDDPPKLLFIGSWRSDEVERSPLVRGVLAHMKRSGLNREELMDLGALSQEESEELASILLPERASLAPAIASESAGSPLFIGELARSRDAAVTSLTAAIGLRVEALPGSARTLLEIVAVAGRPIAQRVALRAAGLPASDDAIAMLRAAQLLRSSGAQLDAAVETYHDRIRESVVAALPKERRTAHHRVLADIYAAEAEPPVEALTHHYREAGDPEQARAFAVRAAERAAQAFAFDRAADFYREAISLASESDLRTKLADALANAGHALRAADAYLAAAKDANESERIDLERRAAYEILRLGHTDRGAPLMKELLAKAGLWMPARVLVAYLIGLALAFWYAWRGVPLLAHDRESDPRELQRIDVGQSLASALALVDTRLSGYFAATSLRRAITAGDRRRLASGLFQVSWYVSTILPSAARRLEEWSRYQTELAAELGEPRFEANVALARAAAEYSWGHWREVRATAATAAAIYERCHGVGSELHYARMFGAYAELFLGDRRAQRELISKLNEQAREGDNLLSRVALVFGVTYLMLAADEPDAALREADEALAHWPRKAFEYPQVINLTARMLAWLYLGKGDRAAAEIEEAWPEVRRSGMLFMPFARALLHTLRGMSSVGGADASEEKRAARIEAARASAQAIRSAGIEGFFGLASMIEAGAAFVAGDRVLAAKALERAIVLYDRHGMREWCAGARAQLARVRGDEDALAASHSELNAKRPERLTAALAPGFDRL